MFLPYLLVPCADKPGSYFYPPIQMMPYGSTLPYHTESPYSSSMPAHSVSRPMSNVKPQLASNEQ